MHTFQRMSWSFVIGNAFKKYFKRKKMFLLKVELHREGKTEKRKKERVKDRSIHY